MRLIAEKRSYIGEDGEILASVERVNVGRPDFHVTLELGEGVSVVAFNHMEDLKFFLDELEKAWSNSPC